MTPLLHCERCSRFRLRAVATELGTTASGLYRYDDLFARTIRAALGGLLEP